MTAVTIAGQVAAMVDTPAGQAPGEAMGVFAREQAEVAAGGIPDGVIASDALLPDADLFEPLGAPGMLQDAIGDQRAVVVLYRGAWCPCCTITVRTCQSELPPELTRRRVALVAISPQRPDGSLTIRQKHELTFIVLSAPSSQARAARLRLGLDLTTVSADGTGGVPTPTTIITDADHVARWVGIHPDYTTRAKPGQILAALGGAGR